MNKLIFILVVFVTFYITSCNDSNFKSSKESFTTKEVSEMIKGDVLLVDVRNANELAEQSFDVKNIINIPLDSIETKMNLIPKDKQVILACQSGNRSGQTFEILKKKGFRNIANMEGGMNEWSDKGLPTQTNEIIAGSKKNACCANPNSKDCNPNGTCKTTAKVEEKPCCESDDKSTCSSENSTSISSNKMDGKNRLEVFAFHGTNQCTTCKNMKANTKSTLDKYFAEELKSGKITFQIIDVDDAKNEKIAEKFEATGTALMFNHITNGKDEIIDLSDFAFEKANEKTEFIEDLKKKIDIELGIGN